MSKCLDCAEENINDSLFCKRCGRFLLLPDPIKGQQSADTNIEHHKTSEGIDLTDSLLVRKSGAARIMRRRRDELSVYRKPLMLLNLLGVILITHIIVALMSM